MRSVEGNTIDTARSAVFLDPRLVVSVRCLRGLRRFVGFGRQLALVLLIRRRPRRVVRGKGLRLFRHGERSKENRGQNERAGNTHSVGHLENLLAWQVLFGAATIRVFGRGKKSECLKGLLRSKQQLSRSARNPVARGLVPVERRSGPKNLWRYRHPTSAAHWSGDKSPRHKSSLATGKRVKSNRQMNPERIHPSIAAHKHIPAMHQRDGLDDRQAQAVVVAAVAARSIHPVKPFEQAR